MDRVSRRFGSGQGAVSALHKVSLGVSSGEVVALTGRSGSGKTTLLRLIAGLDRVNSGEIFVGDEAVHQLSSSGRERLRRQRVSLVFQEYNLVPELTASENVRLALHLAGVRGVPQRTAAQEALSRLGLEGLGERRPARLSGGEQQRVAIARALAVGTEVILADEPTGSLDAENAAVVMDCLHQAAADGAAVLVATHDPEVLSRATRGLAITRGALHQA